MDYTPPAYNDLAVDLGSDYTPPIYSAINVDLSVSDDGPDEPARRVVCFICT